MLLGVDLKRSSKITSDTHWKCVKDKYPGLDLDTLLNYTDCAKELADEFKADTLFKSEKEVNSLKDYVSNIHNIRGNLHLFQVMIELHHLKPEATMLFSQNKKSVGCWMRLILDSR